MRCSIIILSLALTLLAAPLPQDQALAVDKRYTRNHDGKIVNSRVVDERAFRATHPPREAEVDERGFRTNHPREAEVDERGFRTNHPREAEVDERGFRTNHPREAEAEPGFRTNHPREAEAEPAIRVGNQKAREAEAEPILRSSKSGGKQVGRSVVDVSLRDIYNSARGMKSAIVEALKGRGFNSSNLLEPM